ncbi:hypothetical protein Tco_1449422 [Tanacetum coccineum]
MPLSDKTILDSHCFVHELKKEMNDDLEYVNSLEKELDELESEKADFSNIYDLLLEECVSKDVTCSYLHSLSDLNANTELQCLYLSKSKNVMKSVETQFNKPSVVRQPNAQRIPKPSVLGKPTPFSNSPEMRSFQTKQSVNKTNVSDGLFKQVTQQNLPQIRITSKFVNNNVIAPGHLGIPKTCVTSSHQGKSRLQMDWLLTTTRESLEKCTTSTGQRSEMENIVLMFLLDFPASANGCKPKPRNWQASMSSRVSNKDVHLGEHRKQKPFLKFNDLQCPTCKKCLYSANHDECVLEYLSRLNPNKTDPQQFKPRSSMFKRRLIAADQASVFMAMTSVHISSGFVLHQMTSDHNRSELGIHVHSNEQSSSKLVPKVVPLANKTATSRQELELLFHLHIAMLRTTGSKRGSIHCCQNHKLIADMKTDIMEPSDAIATTLLSPFGFLSNSKYSTITCSFVTEIHPLSIVDYLTPRIVDIE